MNTQEQIDALRTEIERIKNHIGLPDSIHIHQGNLNHSEKPNSCEPDYTHLLPEGYEFCAEGDAEKWVKVEMKDSSDHCEFPVGLVENFNEFIGTWKSIRPIQYHVAIHESVTAEPDPYQVDWDKAPEGTVGHHYQMDGYGWFDRLTILQGEWVTISEQSGHTLPSGLDWKQSLRVNPKLK